MTEFFLFMHLQSIAPEKSWLEGVNLIYYKVIRKINVREMKQNYAWRL